MLKIIHNLIWRYMLRTGMVLQCSDAPDTSGMNAAALASAEVGREALAFYKEQFAQAAPVRDRANQIALEVAQQQLDASKSQQAIADDYAAYNKNTFRPLEQGIVADAQTYDTPEKRQAAADAAMSDVNQAFAKTTAATARTLAANGVNPGSARAMAVQQGQAVDQAKANAGAAYLARKGVEATGQALKMDAASLGRNLPSSQTAAVQTALQAGNSAAGNAQTPVNVATQATQTMGQGYGTAISGNQAAGNLYGQAAQIQANADNGGLWGALGSLGGAAISKWSDENLKTDITPTDPDQALEEVTSTPVSDWKYSPAKMAAKGIPMEPDMEGEQTGPMAQDVAATMGEEAAPGGKKINLVAMNGKTMAAVQALDKKVDRLASMIAGGRLQAGA